jgi:hypothetical protein
MHCNVTCVYRLQSRIVRPLGPAVGLCHVGSTFDHVEGGSDESENDIVLVQIRQDEP